jgi:trehalose/maltose hydrolase-like predicted phosphorylase/hydroxymethylpyrimidine pyrophosphatase-like HAD family hydrolase
VTVTGATTRAGARRDRLPEQLARRFEAVVFDWDGTAVTDRAANAQHLRTVIEELCARGLHLAVVTGTHVGNVDTQLDARPAGPGRLYLCVNRGSEVYRADEADLRLIYRREATANENAALDRAAEATVKALTARGLRAEIVSQRLNRRKIDLIPEPEWHDPPKSQIAELLSAVESRLRDAGIAGLPEAVQLAEVAARTSGLDDPRVSSDAKHVEIGLTDKSDASRWVFAELFRCGVGPGLVLIAGDEFGQLGGLPGSDSLLLVPEAERASALTVGAEPTGVPAGVIAFPGGPDRFVALLEDQCERRRRLDVPELDGDREWTLTVEGIDPHLERAHESLLTISDGWLGTRGTPLFRNPETDPGVFAAGIYCGTGHETELAHAPDWASLPGTLTTDAHLVRRLDLRTGLLHQDGPASSLQFSSLALPATVAMRVQAPRRKLPADGRHTVDGNGVSATFGDRRNDGTLERIGTYAPTDADATRALAAAEELGFERLLVEHRETWAERWANADVVIEGDPELQRAVRLALFHLIGAVGDRDEAAVGARGLSGEGYRGHVFWDSDVFVLPFVAATHPPAARAMLEYRIRRLPAAREIARRLGRAGARFPWESASDGFDVTPTHAHLPTGEIARIRTGELEEHIVADVAWAAACYLDWTGDTVFAEGPARELFLETARYWASRIRTNRDGLAHIYGVIGPDEYHQPIDDNAFTNVMARWNLRRGAELNSDEQERLRWLELADGLVDGYDEMSGIYEQFAGFSRLEPLIIADVAPRRPIAAELLLGTERTSAAQVVKQADVLMLHHLVPEEVVRGSLLPNLDFYEPRTAHGSSLSPAIHAALHARAGRFRDALAALRIAARIDLDDLTGTTASGIHLATMGGLWQALVFGFAGVRPRGGILVVEPRLPPEWQGITLRLRFRGRPLGLRIDRDGVALDSEPELVLRRRDHIWEVHQK